MFSHGLGLVHKSKFGRSTYGPQMVWQVGYGLHKALTLTTLNTSGMNSECLLQAGLIVAKWNGSPRAQIPNPAESLCFRTETVTTAKGVNFILMLIIFGTRWT